MNTLDHLTRIAANDERHIVELKEGKHGTISWDVLSALFPGERWAFNGKSLGKFDECTTLVKPWSEFSGLTETGPQEHSKIWPEGGYWEVIPQPGAVVELHHFAEQSIWEVAYAQVILNWIPATHPDAQEVNRRAIAKDPSLIMDWVNPSEELVKYAIDTEPKVFHLLRNPSDDVIKHAIRCRPYLVHALDSKWLDYALDYEQVVIAKIDDPTEEQCWRAIHMNVWNIIHIKCQTRVMQWYVLTLEPILFKYIVHPTDDMKWYAIRQKPNNISHIKNRTPEMELEAIKLCPNLFGVIRKYTPEFLEAMESSTKPFNIMVVPQDKWTDALMVKAAAFSNNHCILEAHNQFTKSLALQAARQHGVVVKYFDEDVMLAAVRTNPNAVIQTNMYNIACIRANPQCFQFIGMPSWEETELAVSLDRRMLMHVTNTEWIRKLKAQFV